MKTGNSLNIPSLQLMAVLSSCAHIDGTPGMAVPSGLVVREKVLATMPQHEQVDSFQVSPDYRHVAMWLKEDGGQALYIDGKLMDRCDEIGGGPVYFSMDGKRAAWQGREGAEYYLNIDGKRATGCQTAEAGPGIFGPDSKDTAYVVIRDRRCSVITGGKEGRDYEKVIGDSVTFSPDGRSLGYKVRLDGGWAMVRDGVAGEVFDNIMTKPVFSKDGRMAFAAKKGSASFVVVDGRRNHEYDSILQGPIFSPDGSHYAYVSRNGTGASQKKGGDPNQGSPKIFVIKDGVELPGEYQDIANNSLTFSGDGKLLGFVDRRAGERKKYVVINGEVGRPYDNVLDDRVCFNADGKRYGFIAASETGYFTVVDGIEGPPSEQSGPLTFSPDGKAAYVAKRGDNYVLFEGGTIAVSSKMPFSEVAYSADGGVRAYTAKAGEKFMVVLDGKDGLEYDRIISSVKNGKPTGIVFDGPRSLHFIAINGRNVFFVEQEAQTGP